MGLFSSPHGPTRSTCICTFSTSSMSLLNQLRGIRHHNGVSSWASSQVRTGLLSTNSIPIFTPPFDCTIPTSCLQSKVKLFSIYTTPLLHHTGLPESSWTAVSTTNACGPYTVRTNLLMSSWAYSQVRTGLPGVLLYLHILNFLHGSSQSNKWHHTRQWC